MKSLCPFCGCGCRLDYVVKKGKIIKVLPDKEDSLSEGKPCIKGLASHESLKKGRLKTPLVRKNGKLKKASWKEAYNRIKQEFGKLKPEEIGFYASGMASNEANYLFQKFAREVIKTNTIDSSAQLCHASTLKAFKMAFGIGAMSANMDDLKFADCILIIGSDPKSDYPVAFNRVLEAQKKGAKVIVVEDSYSYSSEFADVHVEIDIGMFLPVLNFLAKQIIDNKKYHPDSKIMNGFYELKEKIDSIGPKELSRITGANLRSIKKMLDAVLESKKICIMHGMAMTQHLNGTKNVIGVTNLAHLKKGKVVCMRGKCNIQGCGDMKCSSGEHDTFLELMFANKLKAAYILDSNISQSFPELDKVHKRLRNMFVVFQGSYKNSMNMFADVILPAAHHLESSGTMTNAERRVRHFERVIEPEYGRSHWKIIKDLFAYFGKPIKHKSIWDTTKEIIKKIPAYQSLNLKKIKSNNGAFADKEHKKSELIPVKFTMLEEEKTWERPYLLTTKRLPWHFVTGDMTRRSKTLKKMAKDPACLMNPKDMKKEKIKDNSWVNIESECSRIRVRVRENTDVSKGRIVMPFHFEKYLVNKLIPFQLDPISREPNLKIVDVKITKAKK